MLAAGMRASGFLGLWLFPATRVIGLAAGLVRGALASWGSELSANTGEDTVETWQVEQGLPQISVVSIAQSPDGYLWRGTFNGVRLPQPMPDMVSRRLPAGI